MAAKPGSVKKSGSTRRKVGARDNNQLVAELKNRIAVLENELRLKQGEASSHDVAERKRAGVALKLASYSMDNARDSVIWFCPDGRIYYANDAACRLYGYSRDEMLSLTMFDINPRNTPERWNDRWLELKMKGSAIYETENWTKDGRRFPIEVTNTFIKYEDQEFMVSYVRDINERRRAKEERLLLVHDLRERMKEQTALYSAACILQQQPTVQDMLQKIVEILPAAWQYPEVTTARIVYGGCEYRAPGFCVGKWCLSTDFVTIDSKRGTIEIFYIEEKPSEHEGPFLAEERNLINSLADMLRIYIDRKRAEEALKGSEAKFRGLFEGAGTAIFVADVVTGTIIDCNGMAESLIGRPRNEIIGLHQTQLHPADVSEVQRAQFARHARGIGTNNDEALVQHRDGRIIPVIINATPLMIDGREIIIGFFFDITERKQHEEALRESEEKFRALAESSQTGILLIQGEDIAYINNALAGMLGYTLEDVAHIKYWDVAPQEMKDYIRERGNLRQKGFPGPSRNELMLIGKHGEHVWLDCTAAVITYRKMPAMLLTAIDITERKQYEEALRESEEKFRVLAETAPVAICILQDGRFQYVNDSTESISGYDRDYLLSTDFLDLVHPDFRGPVAKLYADWLDGRIRNLARFETKFLPRGGTERWIDASVNTVEYRGRPGLIMTASDVTERKRAEEELKMAKAQAELYLDLMGHDINNMHQIALGYLELARGMPPGVQHDEMLEKPIEVLQRSTQLIRNVRKLQKLHDRVFKSQDIDVCGTLVDVQREFGAVPHKAITLNMNGCERCHVRANELLHDVFANLVSNAIKHTGDSANIVIDLDAIKDNGRNYCRVMVEDDGPGIPDDFKDKIFNRLLKGTTKAKGMGLGLYLVKSLVDSYGGRIWVEDRVKGDHTKGAKFVVMLPTVDNH